MLQVGLLFVSFSTIVPALAEYRIWLPLMPSVACVTESFDAGTGSGEGFCDGESSSAKAAALEPIQTHNASIPSAAFTMTPKRHEADRACDHRAVRIVEWSDLRI